MPPSGDQPRPLETVSPVEQRAHGAVEVQAVQRAGARAAGRRPWSRRGSARPGRSAASFIRVPPESAAAALAGEVEQHAGGAVVGDVGEAAARGEQPPARGGGGDRADGVPAAVRGHLGDRAVRARRSPARSRPAGMSTHSSSPRAASHRGPLAVFGGGGGGGRRGQALHGLVLPTTPVRHTDGGILRAMSEATVDVADLRQHGRGRSRRRHRRPAAGRHPAARPGARRGDRRADRRRGARPRRAHARRRVRGPPVRRRPRRARRPAGRARRPRRPTTSSAPSATSRCWPTSPRTSTTSGAGSFHRRSGSPPQPGSLAASFAILDDARPGRRRRGRRAGRRARRPGGHRAPDRGPPQDDHAGTAPGHRTDPPPGPFDRGPRGRPRVGGPAVARRC